MDRRTTLTTLLGKKNKSDHNDLKNKIFQKAEKTGTTSSGLDPYTGPWEYEQAAHRLRRTTYGPTYVKIKDAVQNGLDNVITQLFAVQTLPSPPINYNYEDDSNVPIGTTWIDSPYSLTENFIGYRNRSLVAWTMGLMANEEISIREKMTLFWHNHFVIGDINDPKFVYKYITLLRENALGNFKDLVKKVTIDPAMLRYLNGNENTKTAPNENYARELMELFTLGKGDLAGPGDYTTFTEDDVVAMAKVLTGWRDIGFFTLEFNQIDSVFIANRHDTDPKQLSHRFDNVIIDNSNDEEYADLIDIIFQKEEVSKFICRKLYRWFVYYKIDDDVEQNIIVPMAQLLVDNDYEIAPVLEALLKSDHFYDVENYGCMIKNPMDFTMAMINQFEVQIPTDLELQYRVWLTLYEFPTILQMQYYSPPSVAGWKAYYQEPSFYQIWTNSVTLPFRAQLAGLMLTTGINIPGDNPIIDVLAFLDTVDDPYDVNNMLDEFIKIIFSKDISQNQKDYLKAILIPGLPDFEWNVEYTEYASDPGNETLANSIRNKLTNLFFAMLTMPEYHLS